MKKQVKLGIALGTFTLCAILKTIFPGSNGENAVETIQTQTFSGTAVTRTINIGEYLGETETSVSPAVEEAVAVFLTQQQPYASLAVPSNVSYEVCSIPFGYTVPVHAETSSGFGYRVHPLDEETKFHYGTDFAANAGDDIVSFAEGIVSSVDEDDGYGKHIRIQHDDGYESLYAHCSKIYVAEGQYVQAGEKIALVGATGKVTGPHLHFELSQNGIYTNPEFYLAGLS